MQRRRLYLWFALATVVVLLAVASGDDAIAFGELDECDGICGDKCADNGGCAYYYTEGCECVWICENGEEGRTYCGAP